MNGNSPLYAAHIGSRDGAAASPVALRGARVAGVAVRPMTVLTEAGQGLYTSSRRPPLLPSCWTHGLPRRRRRYPPSGTHRRGAGRTWRADLYLRSPQGEPIGARHRSIPSLAAAIAGHVSTPPGDRPRAAGGGPGDARPVTPARVVRRGGEAGERGSRAGRAVGDAERVHTRVTDAGWPPEPGRVRSARRSPREAGRPRPSPAGSRGARLGQHALMVA